MPDSWASSDLHLELSGVRKRQGVEDAIREAVRTQRLTGGTALPSSRALAAELGLARNTVADAYGQLVAEGWLTARQGSVTRVATRGAPSTESNAKPVVRQSARLAYDLRPGQPDLSGFPRTAWAKASRKALAEAPSDAFGYPDPRGHPGLRRTLSEYLARVRGVRASPENLMVCTGFGQALALMAAALDQGGGRSVAMEEYGLTHHLEILDHASFDTPLMGVDDAGARTSDLSDTDAAAVLLTPAHQFPIGVPLSAARRSAALEWARARRAVVIEDDYDGEFRYDARPVGALQSLAPELVAYVGTASKSLAPAVHLAWLAVPPGLLDAVVEAKRLADGFTGVLEQLTLDELIRSGAYDRHVRRSRMRYRRRRDRLVAELAVRSPQVSVTGIAAGLHAVVRLGAGLTASEEEAVCSRAARAGLGIQGLGRFRRRPDPGAAAALVVGYGTPPEHAFAGAVDALCDSLA